MAEQKAQTQPKIKPVIPAQAIQARKLQACRMSRDPFSKQKLTLALGKDTNQSVASGALIAPELARRKEASGRVPAGHHDPGGQHGARPSNPLALVKVGPLAVPGSTRETIWGKTTGESSKLMKTEITLREIVQDAVGEWIERSASLLLQERSK